VLASKRTSFFQTINVIAAIFLAKVRRSRKGLRSSPWAPHFFCPLQSETYGSSLASV